MNGRNLQTVNGGGLQAYRTLPMETVNGGLADRVGANTGIDGGRL